MAKILGDDFEVIEEGCNNRTGFFLNPDGILQSGQQYLPECLKKHKKFDIFVLALGTNDLQKIFQIDENIVKSGLKNLIATIKKFNINARIIVVTPVVLDDNVLKGYFNYQFDENSIEASIWMQKTYEIVAQKENCELLDINKYVYPSNIDGLHYDEKSHKIIAEQVAVKISYEKQKVVSEVVAVS